VKAVKKRGGAANAYAVCKAAMKNPAWHVMVREPGEKKWEDSGEGPWDKKSEALEFARAEVGVPYKVVQKRGNPAAEADAAFKEFHGYAPTELVTVKQKIHQHKHLAAAGDLVGFEVKPVDGGKKRRIEGFEDALLCFNEKKNQLFVQGGDQYLSPKELAKFGADNGHELETLGKLTGVGYFTNKTHLGKDGGEAIYDHKFRTTNENGRHITVTIARYPDLIYRVLDQQFEVSGGSYTIRAEGIDK
jgi:hypothetical protein